MKNEVIRQTYFVWTKADIYVFLVHTCTFVIHSKHLLPSLSNYAHKIINTAFRATIQELFLYCNLYLSVKLVSLSLSFTFTPFLIN